MDSTIQLLPADAVYTVYERLRLENPNPRSELHWKNVYTLLVAVVLSAQATDVGVNKATAPLFERVETPEQMVALGEEGLKGYINSINLYPTKAKRPHNSRLDKSSLDRGGFHHLPRWEDAVGRYLIELSRESSK